MITKELKEYLKDEGWTIECETPLEVHHEDGSSATGLGASIVVDYYRKEMDYISSFLD